MKFGLLGKSLSHSFSKSYFTKKFNELEFDHSYSNIEIPSILEVKSILTKNEFQGLNVTIPYKEEIIPFLDEVSTEAREIGAVNTILFRDGKSIGHNTDWIGVYESLLDLKKSGTKALIFGSGGASKAVQFALQKLNVGFKVVSRTSEFNYENLSSELIEEHGLLIQCTPLGTFPNGEEKIEIPYRGIGSNHILFDLVYNPAETAFLKEGIARNAQVMNGLSMLKVQAEEAWKIWMED